MSLPERSNVKKAKRRPDPVSGHPLGMSAFVEVSRMNPPRGDFRNFRGRDHLKGVNWPALRNSVGKIRMIARIHGG